MSKPIEGKVATVIAAVSTGVTAKAADGTAVAAALPFPAWDSFVDGLRELWPKMAAKIPERLRNDAQFQQEVGRCMLEALVAMTIEAVSGDGDHPVFLPYMNLTLNVFAPNADTVYRSATITPGGTYRLRGEVGSVRILMLGQFGPTLVDTGKDVTTLGYNDFKSLHVDPRGRFDVIVSPARPEGYSGDWWQLDPKATSLLLRQMSSDWANERDPRISIERLDKPVYRLRPSVANLERRLLRLPAMVANTATVFVDRSEQLRREGYINNVKVYDVTSLGALVGQFYYQGAYELAPDEALIFEAEVPEKCGYSSTILINDIHETIDWYNNPSSINDAQGLIDSDRILRLVISEKDPGVPNWLSTAGYPTGLIQGRWTNCSSAPVPTIRKITLTDVRKFLPSDTPTVTPAQREQMVRDRRAALQQRPLW